MLCALGAAIAARGARSGFRGEGVYMVLNRANIDYRYFTEVRHLTDMRRKT
jgi:hypothetical protein